MKRLAIMLPISLFIMMSCNKVDSECIDKSAVNPDQICTMDYTPVCGCDGRTYSNACVAGSNGVKSFEQGECP